MYSHEYEWPNRYYKERSSSTSSCESSGKQTVVTALVEPSREEKLKINCNNIKTKNFQTVPKRKQHIDLDKIEVCNPINSHQIFKEQKQQINITRTLMQLNQNIDNEINKKQQGANIKKLESKKDAFLTQEDKAEEQDKQRRKIVNFDVNTEDRWSPCKRQRITKSPDENIEELSKSLSPKLLAKETSSSESNEETERSGSEALCEILDELQDQQFLTELEKAFIEWKDPTMNTDISKENRTLYDGNKRETINCSVDSTKISRPINSNLIETENILKSDLDKNETYSSTVIAECVITAQNSDINSIISNIGEAILSSHANNVKTLLEVIRQPVNPSLVNFYNVLMQLNNKLSNYLKK